MAGDKPTMILKAKTDMSKDEIAKLSDSEAWKLIYTIRTTKAKDNRLQVCFTGFGISKKIELENLAQENRFKVVSSITKKLDFLVCGDNSGPKKIEKAKSQGVELINEIEYVHLLQTGELPQ